MFTDLRGEGGGFRGMRRVGGKEGIGGGGRERGDREWKGGGGDDENREKKLGGRGMPIKLTKKDFEKCGATYQTVMTIKSG